MKRPGWLLRPGLLLVMNIAVLLAVLATLFAFSPRRARGAEGNARWSRADLPVQVLVAPEALDHHGAIARAVLILNRAAGAELFAFPRAVTLVYVKDIMRGGHLVRGHVLVRADGEFVPATAHTEPVFSRPGVLYAAVVTLPRERVPDWMLRAAILHEWLHAAGRLAHETDPGCVGYQVLLPAQRLCEATRRWLRGYR